jgi:hypothetical protein
MPAITVETLTEALSLLPPELSIGSALAGLRLDIFDADGVCVGSVDLADGTVHWGST